MEHGLLRGHGTTLATVSAIKDGVDLTNSVRIACMGSKTLSVLFPSIITVTMLVHGVLRILILSVVMLLMLVLNNAVADNLDCSLTPHVGYRCI
jgi:hypothetical protein